MSEKGLDATPPQTAATAGAPAEPAPIFLRAEDVRQKAREALTRGDLPSAARLYSAPCAIGLSLTPDQRRWIAARTFNGVNGDETRIGILIEYGIVQSDNREFLEELQDANDDEEREALAQILNIAPPQNENTSSPEVAQRAGSVAAVTPSVSEEP